MATPQEVNFSELLQKPSKTVDALYQASRRGLRLVRRGEEDLYLTTAARADQATWVVRTNTLMIRAIMNDPDASPSIVEHALAAALPWVRFLPAPAQREFLDELIEVSRASTELELLGPIFQVLAEWKHTAEIYADPDLAKSLAVESTDDLGPVCAPEAVNE